MTYAGLKVSQERNKSPVPLNTVLIFLVYIVACENKYTQLTLSFKRLFQDTLYMCSLRTCLDCLKTPCSCVNFDSSQVHFETL